MPELPEVETLKTQLIPHVVGKTIARVYFHPDFGNTIKFRNTTDLEAELPGRKITEVSRFAKYLSFTLDNTHRLIFHLKIYGRIVTNNSFVAPLDHMHRCSLTLDDDTHVRLLDKSNIADMRLLTEEEFEDLRTKYGPEPFDLDPHDFYLRVISAKLPRIKDVLLDQHIISGIGNIYADEALFISRISPFRRPSELSEEETAVLLRAVHTSLQSGIEHRGTSIESFYDTEGIPGENQKYLLCYGRSGKPCVSCSTPLILTELSGRRTTYCSICQPELQLTLF